MILRGNNPNREKTHCPHGHPYDLENTIVGHGQRLCRQCQAAHKKAYVRRHHDRVLETKRRYYAGKKERERLGMGWADDD